MAEHRKDGKGMRWYPKADNYRTADDIARRGELPPEKVCVVIAPKSRSEWKQVRRALSL